MFSFKIKCIHTLVILISIKHTTYTILISNYKYILEIYEIVKKMPSFCELNLNVTNLSQKAIEQLVETAIKCKFF